MAKRLMMLTHGQLRPLSFDRQHSVPPLLSSASTEWAGLPFELHELPTIDESWEGGPPPGQRGILVLVDGNRTWTQRHNQQDVEIQATPGTVIFQASAALATFRRMIGEAYGLAFGVPPCWEERLLREGAPKSFIPMAPIIGDSMARALALTMIAEVRTGAQCGAMFAEALSLALIRLIVERSAPALMRVRGVITEGQRRQIVRYLDERIGEDVRMADVAALTGLHQRRFSELFRNAFGMRPYRFWLERRLWHGARLLTTTTADVAEVALQVGFCSQSHFSDAFRKVYGTSPRRYALCQRSTFVFPPGATLPSGQSSTCDRVPTTLGTSPP